MAETKKEQKKKDKGAVRLLKYLIPTAVVLAIIALVLNFTGAGSAAKVNGQRITVADYNKRVSAQQKYQTEFQKVDFSTNEGKKKLSDLKKKVVEQMVEEEVISQEAAKLDISVSSDEVQKEYEKMAQANKDEDKLKELYTKYYGYEKAEFEKYSIIPKLLRQKVQDRVMASDETNKVAKDKAENLLKEIKNGADFSELAKKNSDDPGSASKGGDLGWIEKGKMVPEFEKVAFSLQAGEVSSVIKTTYGYHIVKKLEPDKNGKAHVAHILVKIKSLSDWVSEKVKAAEVTVYVKY